LQQKNRQTKTNPTQKSNNISKAKHKPNAEHPHKRNPSKNTTNPTSAQNFPPANAKRICIHVRALQLAYTFNSLPTFQQQLQHLLGSSFVGLVVGNC
jgi:hypothetical protein